MRRCTTSRRTALASARALGGIRCRGRDQRVDRPVGQHVARRQVETIEHTRDKGLARHGVQRPAPRPRLDLRFLARPRSGRRSRRPATSPASPPKTRCGTARADQLERQSARPRPVPPVGCSTPSRRSTRAALRGGRVRRQPAGRQLRGRQRLHLVGPLRARQHARLLGRLSVLAPLDLGVAPIAGDASGMQRDDWYTSSRVHARTGRGREASATTRRGARSRGWARASCDARKCPVLFEAPLACGLLGNFVQAASGGSLYRKSSFLVDALGKPVFADAHQLARGSVPPARPGSSPFDEEGVAGRERDVVDARRAEGLLPVELLGAQARHGDHRQRRRRPQPRTALDAHATPRTTSRRCCASSAPACWSPS